jgi:predicted TIM-barrel fold metal-dependent hydrolase
VVQLHIARPRRLADPVNYIQLREIEEKYPNLQLIIAHLGRAYADEDLGDALEYLKHTKKSMWDFTANTNDWVMEQVMKYFGPERFIYGSDFPIFRMKARRTVENGVYINEIPQGQFPYESVKNDSHMREIPYPEAEKITFFIYEEMNACRLACQRLGLGKEDVEKIFYSNSARIFGVK